MENRLQYILLTLASVFSILAVGNVHATNTSQAEKLPSEFVEFGLSFGVLNIDNFPQVSALGANATFRATEYAFLQFNYLKTGDVDLSSYEKSSSSVLLADGARSLHHYNMLVGYNLLQGEFFSSPSQYRLSALYVVGGIGETDLDNESRFTYTLGLGYQVELTRRFLLRVDWRDHVYKSNIVVADKGDKTHNVQFSVGVNYLF